MTSRLSPEEIVGRTFDAIGIGPFSALGEDLRRALAGESVNSRIEDGDLTFEAWSVPLREERNNIAGATGVIVDVTERRRLETELSNVQKLEAIGRLAGGIAHDFNNHLTAILGYVEMMLTRSGDADLIGRDLREVQHAGQRAAGLVRRLLAFGRRQVLQPRNLNLNALIEGLTPMLQRLIGDVVQVHRSADVQAFHHRRVDRRRSRSAGQAVGLRPDGSPGDLSPSSGRRRCCRSAR